MATIAKPHPAVERIAKAAVTLFASHGYHGASTREIARLANVSEVTLFRYFESKEDLFLSALQNSLDTIDTCFSPRKYARKLSSGNHLPSVINLLVDIVTLSPELVRLVAIAYLEVHGKAEAACYERLGPLFMNISSALNESMKNGEMPTMNPELATEAITMTILAQPVLSRMVKGTNASQLGAREALREYSKFWLQVLTPATAHAEAKAITV